MITRITGTLTRVLDEEVRLQAGPFEYQVLVPEFVRRQIQLLIGQEVSFHTCHYFDGNPMQGKVVPRLIGFMGEDELEFFELFCTVDKVGTRKALKALIRPVKDIADAIQRQDVKWLTTLPGVGAATADQMVAKLRRKVMKFAMMPDGSGVIVNGNGAAKPTVVAGNLLEDAYQALMQVGHTPAEARDRLDKVLSDGKTYQSVEEIVLAVYNK
jgi:Holliday junction DNA helicase RuvA